MILTIYLIKKFFKSLIVCSGVSYSIFFIFSLIGNLGEKFSFYSILYLSMLNSLQIFTYIPGHLFILSFCLFIVHLKSKNELIVIKEYVELRSLFIVIFPILFLFTFIELNKETLLSNIEKIKTDLISSKKHDDKKILITFDGNKKKYTIFSGFNKNKEIINQYLNIEVKDQKIYKGEISSNLNLLGDDLYSNETTIYENNDFRNESLKKKLFENFFNFWSTNTSAIIKNEINNTNSNYYIFLSTLFCVLFYFCISMIFLSKKLVERNINLTKILFFILSIFLYYLLIPKIMLDNFQFFFQSLSVFILVLIFIKIKKYE